MAYTNRKYQRLCDSLAFLVSMAQRAFLEQKALENGISLGEAARVCIDLAMSSAGAEGC